MKRSVYWMGLVVASLAVAACSSPDSFRVYSSGFSFARYDYVVIAKPSGDTSTLLYGMDVRLGNLLGHFNMNVVGNKELKTMPIAKRKRTLIARMSMEGGTGKIALSVSFDDAVSGKTGASFTTTSGGDLTDPEDRNNALDALTKSIKQALQKGKSLNVSAAG